MQCKSTDEGTGAPPRAEWNSEGKERESQLMGARGYKLPVTPCAPICLRVCITNVIAFGQFSRLAFSKYRGNRLNETAQQGWKSIPPPICPSHMTLCMRSWTNFSPKYAPLEKGSTYQLRPSVRPPTHYN